MAVLITPTVWVAGAEASASRAAITPAKIIFDTDIGNDVDDVMALAMLHALQRQGQCELLAVTITKKDRLAAPFTAAVNAFYGREDLPIGVGANAVDTGGSKFLKLAEATDDGKPRFPQKLTGQTLPEAVQLIRNTLSQQPDRSVCLVQVGFFSNLAALLDSQPDAFSPLNGKELIKQKVKLLSIMAGSFQTIKHNNHYLEYNVIKDIPAAQKLEREWPSPIVWSGYEIGIAAAYPSVSIERDYQYVPHHPVAEAYCLYNPPPHDRPTWDLTAALYAVFPDRGYFDLSSAGQVTVEADGFTRFTPKKNGRDSFLIVNDLQVARLKETFVRLCSQPPPGLPSSK